MRFTGGDNLTDRFQILVHRMFMQNELKEGNGAYEISYANKGKSGYSFGPMQWDLLNSRDGSREMFRDILKNATDSQGGYFFDLNDDGIVSDAEINSTIDKMTYFGKNLDGWEKEFINYSLSSDYGIDKINEFYISELSRKIARIENIIDTYVTDPEDKAFLQTDIGKLLLMDYDNQFFILPASDPNGKMSQFLQGYPVELDNGKFEVFVRNDLGIEDILNFTLHTEYGYEKSPWDVIRRFSNIVEILGPENVFLSEEDADFLSNELAQILGKRYLPIINDSKGENWGIKQLISRANTLFPNMDWTIPQNPWFKNLLEFWGDHYTDAMMIPPPPPRGCPIVFDLDGDGVETTYLTDGAFFDHDGNGFTEQTGWAEADDGLIVRDINGDGFINDGKELFGDQTLLQNGQRAANGFAALADLDSNADGKIDSSDAAFAELKVWQDFDGDGYSSPDELLTLSELGITAINTGSTSSTYVDPNGNEHLLTGTFTKSDGSSGNMDDVWFQLDPTYTIATEWLDVPPEIAALPDLQGYGNVYDLQQAMVRDTSLQLKGLVESFIATSDIDTRNNLLDQILFKWTGVDGIDPGSRGEFIDARKLTALEKLFGQAFIGVGGSNPNANAAALLNQSYRGIFEMFYAQVMAQSQITDLYSLISYTWDDVTQSTRGDLTGVISILQTRLVDDPIAGERTIGEFFRTLQGFDAFGMMNIQDFISSPLMQVNVFRWGFELAGKNMIAGTQGANTLNGTSGADAITGYEGNDTSDGYNGADLLYGGAGADTLYGNEGDDTLIGGTGNDSLEGGGGADRYLFNLGDGQDTISDYDAAGNVTNTVEFGAGITPSGLSLYKEGNDLKIVVNGTTDTLRLPTWFYSTVYRVEQFQFADGTVLTPAQLEALGVTLYGTSGADTLSGQNVTSAGTNDQIFGYEGNDNLYGYAGNDLLDGGPGADNMDGGLGNDTLLGGDGNDSLNGSSGDDLLVGGLGNDILDGGAGSDRYLFNLGDGQDTISDYDAAGNVTNTVEFGAGITPSGLSLYKEGNDLKIVVNGTTDTLRLPTWFYSTVYRVEQFQFADGTVLTPAQLEALGVTLYGTSGADTLSGQNVTSAGTNDQIFGYEGNDNLYGYAGNDLLDGGLGTDTMVGGQGNDIYVVDNAADVVTENANEGTDTVQSSVTYTLGANVENLTLIGTSAINGTGNASNNILVGNSEVNTLNGGAGNDSLDGGAGADSLIGGTGDDIYIVDNSSDVVTENANEGTDTVNSSITYTLGTNIENLTLTGVSAINGTGNSLNNTITGNNENNQLDGGTGADTMIGGNGNDTYIVENAGDVVTENANEGIDAINSSITYTLSANVENLTLTGTSAINGTGNSLDNTLIGNGANNTLTGGSGNDTLNGGAGSDTMIGGTGDDTYFVASTGDVVTENASEGIDTVNSSITYTLGANVENLTLTGTSKINATGNTLDNTLIGNSANNTLTGSAGNDTLDGGAGSDTMRGGTGDDTYFVASTGDGVTEYANEGIDTVNSSITYTLGSNVENLNLTGASAINGTGNTLNNTLTGNSGNNTLTGGAGNDTLGGGAGNDTLAGGTGNDTYIFGSGYGTDTVTENDSTAGNTDTVQLGVNPIDAVFAQATNNLDLTIHGSTDKLTVQSWYSGSAYQAEVFQAADGSHLLNTQVAQLIQAMSTFCANNGIANWDQAITTRPQDVQAILAQYWSA